MSVKLKPGWLAVPSVTTGGKECFYRQTQKDQTVVWDRLLEKWIIQVHHKDVEGHNNYDTPTAAMNAADKMKGN